MDLQTLKHLYPGKLYRLNFNMEADHKLVGYPVSNNIAPFREFISTPVNSRVTEYRSLVHMEPNSIYLLVDFIYQKDHDVFALDVIYANNGIMLERFYTFMKPEQIQSQSFL